MREGYVEWHRAGSTWYEVAGEGDGTPLLCLHGGPGSTHHYFAPLLELADERPVILYDQLGCGGSAAAAAETEWSLALFLEELDALRRVLSLERVHLLGTSWGGMLALEHALVRQESLASLILSSSLASADEWASEVKRLYDAIELDDAAASEKELEARHMYCGDPERAEIRAMRAVAESRRLQGDVGAERVDGDGRARGLGRARPVTRASCPDPGRPRRA